MTFPHFTITKPHHNRDGESGNVIFFILLAIVLIGLVTAAIRSTGDGADIDNETILIRATEIKQYAQELERATRYIIQNGASEEDIRFAHPDAHADYGDINTNSEFQVFHRTGGGAAYRAPANGVQVGGTQNWEFYGHTHAPYIGSNGSPQADIIAVLPDITAAICAKINEMNGFDLSTAPADTGAGDNCVKSSNAMRFDDANQYSVTPNEMDQTTFIDPDTGNERQAPEACVICDDGTYNFYHVLYAR